MSINLKAVCPSCEQPKGAPLLWGMRGLQAFEAEQRGDVILANCDFVRDESGDLPNTACVRCGNQWFDPKVQHNDEEVS